MTKKQVIILIEKVVDNEGTHQDVYQLMQYFHSEFDLYEHFVYYSLLRKLYPKDGTEVMPMYETMNVPIKGVDSKP